MKYLTIILALLSTNALARCETPVECRIDYERSAHAAVERERVARERQQQLDSYYRQEAERRDAQRRFEAGRPCGTYVGGC